MNVEPQVRSEIDELVAYVGEQILSVRNAARGLSTEQARVTPTASALSIGGLLKHAIFVFDGLQRRIEHPDGTMSEEEYLRLLPTFEASFSLADDESIDEVLARFDAAAETYLAGLGALDPEAIMQEPAAPWFGRPDPTPTTARFYLLHQIEELARHAGHADIIREQLDGCTAYDLLGDPAAA